MLPIFLQVVLAPIQGQRSALALLPNQITIYSVHSIWLSRHLSCHEEHRGLQLLTQNVCKSQATPAGPGCQDDELSEEVPARTGEALRRLAPPHIQGYS